MGPLSGDDLSDEGKNAFSAYRWNCRIPGSEDVLRDLFPRNAVVLAIAEQLLGRGRLSDPDSETRGTRGVYCTLPMGDKPKSRSSCHIDDCIDSRTRIDAVCYIDDVKPGAGAFTVWPGSHHKCYRFLTTSADSAANGYAKPSEQQHNRNGGPDSRPSWALGMQEAWEWCEENIHPVDCWGDAGTVVVSHLPARLPCTAIPSLSRLLTRRVPVLPQQTRTRGRKQLRHQHPPSFAHRLRPHRGSPTGNRERPPSAFTLSDPNPFTRPRKFRRAFDTARRKPSACWCTGRGAPDPRPHLGHLA